MRAVASLGIALALVGTVVVNGSVNASAGGPPISGGGSSFAALEIEQWKADTARDPYNLKVNYVSQGSTFGRNAFASNTLDFGASDIVYQPGETTNPRCGGRPQPQCFVYVPVSAGGLSFMYNLTDSSGGRVSNLRLTRQAACKIFTGAITKWNDPELVATNPQLSGFNRDIAEIVRADGAGESFVLSQFCLTVAPDVWHAFIAKMVAADPSAFGGTAFAQGQPTSSWPDHAWGHVRAIATADNVANNIADPGSGKDSIGYMAAGYAKVRGFPVASTQNAAGVFTQPDETNVTVALGYASGRPDGTFDLNYTGPDPRAYFPSTYSYVIAQTTGEDPAKGAALAQFLCYSVSKGQEIGPQLRYARLSTVLVQIAIGAISKIPGAPPPAQCPVAGSQLGIAAITPLDAGNPAAINAAAGKNTSAAAQAAAAAAEAAAREAAANAAKAKNIDDKLSSIAGSLHKGHGVASWWFLVIGALAAWLLATIIGRKATS